MRATEDRLIPAVQRFTFPPEAAPHSVASQPPPSYVTPTHDRAAQPRAYGMSLEAFEAISSLEKGSVDADGTVGVGRYIPGRKIDMIEAALGKPREDYTLLHSFNPHTAECAQLGERIVVGRGGKHAQAVAYAAFADDPQTRGAHPSDQAVARNFHVQALVSHQAAFEKFRSVSKRPVPPFVVDLGVLGMPADASGCASDHNPYASRLPKTRSQPPVPPGSTPKDIFEASINFPSGESGVDGGSCAHHLRDTARAVRNYNTLHPHHRKPSAISTISTAFARSPKSPHKANKALASPCERIAANYSQAAWGLSARTLQHLSRGAISKVSAPDISAVDLSSLGNANQRLPFMPLELFDDEELELKKPHEWLSIAPPDECVMGKTEWLNINTGQTEARRVQVHGYDEVSCTYQVEYVDSGVKKSVKRLNLMFDAEDPKAFAHRVDAAKAQRAAAESDLRWRFFLDSSIAEEVLDVYDFAAKVAAVHEGCKGISIEVLSRLRAQLISDFYDSYCLGIRIGHLEYHRLNPAIEQQLNVLGLPRPKQKLLAPRKGVIDVTQELASPSVSFPDVRFWARSNLLLASAVLNKVLQVRSE